MPCLYTILCVQNYSVGSSTHLSTPCLAKLFAAVQWSCVSSVVLCLLVQSDLEKVANGANSVWEMFLTLGKFGRPNQDKLDQETWLCGTHLDDLKDNIWTILDHIRSYLTVSDHFGPFCTSF